MQLVAAVMMAIDSNTVELYAIQRGTNKGEVLSYSTPNILELDLGQSMIQGKLQEFWRELGDVEANEETVQQTKCRLKASLRKAFAPELKRVAEYGSRCSETD